MMDAGRHPKIELLTFTEIEDITGFIGNFNVRVRRKTRYVDEKECTACGECAEVCPAYTADEYQEGLSARKAIHIPFPQAVPSSYLIDMETCLGISPIACGKCVEACEKECIDFDLQDRILEFKVGVVITATGMDVYDPTEMDEYGYRSYPNVITSMEFERLICSGGPTEGHFVRPGDMARPKRIGFIQCVGSRSASRGNPYCSNICCMNTVKDTLLLRDHYPDTECFVFYIDIRAFGKGFEDLYKKSLEAGVHYIRGLPGDVLQDPETGNLKVTVENTTAGRVEHHELDLLVLSTGVIPRRDNATIRKLLTLSKSEDGFMMEAHPKLKPVDAPTRGVFFAGCVESPKDIKDSVTQAGAAAARAQAVLNKGSVKVEALTCRIDENLCKGCNACVGVCPFGAIRAAETKKTPPTVVEAACAGCGTCGAACRFGAITMRHFTDAQMEAQIDSILAEDTLEKVLVFACNWCSYAGGDMAGISRLAYPPNVRLIRTMCSGRVSEEFVLRAFQKGAPIVLVSGCHFADCHYIDANRQTVVRVERLWDRMERWGIRPERLQLEWISAAEGQKFAKVMREMEKLRQQVTAEEVEETIRILNTKRSSKSAGEKTGSGAAPL